MTTTNRPIVDTESGSVQGVAEDGVAAFRGIPYAASPVGDLRFSAPRRHPKWSGPRDASRPGPSVPQAASRLEAVMGPRIRDWDEDGSLTVSVWTPRLPDGGSAAPALPVLVWFHGGGFTSGSGGWDWYDGRNLAAAGEVVVVTANLRPGRRSRAHRRRALCRAPLLLQHRRRLSRRPDARHADRRSAPTRRGVLRRGSGLRRRRTARR